MTPPPMTITSGSKMFARPDRATPSRRPIVSSTADRDRVAGPGELGDEAAVDRRPPFAAARARPESGAAAAARSASRRSAVPDAIDSMQPWLGQLPWQGGPSMSTTTCPSSAAGPVGAAVGLAAEDQPAADAGADRQQHDVHGRRGRRRSRCSAIAATLPSLSIETGRPIRSRDPVADGDVDQRQVDRAHADPAGAVDRAGHPEADGGDPRPRVEGDLELGSSSCQDLVGAQPGGGGDAPVDGPPGRRRRPRRASSCRRDRRRSSRRPPTASGPRRSRSRKPGGHAAVLPRNGTRRPRTPGSPRIQRLPGRIEGPGTRATGRAETAPSRLAPRATGASDRRARRKGPGYTVYKARRGFKRSGDGPSLRERLPGRGGSKPRAAGREADLAQGPALGADRRRGLAADQLRRLRGLRPDPEVEAQRPGGGGARRLPAAARSTARTSS